MSRWLRRLFVRPGPRFCSNCGERLAYQLLAKRDTDSGAVSKWQWAAACPRSSVLFSGMGSWTGNGATRTHTLVEYAGPPLWTAPMARALVMRRILRSDGWRTGYGERLYETETAR